MTHNTPDFLIVGAAKSGTTALSNFLKQHPEIYMSEVKEPRYFARNVLKKINRDDPQCDYLHRSSVFKTNDYYNLFNAADDYKRRGEASVHYLFHHNHVIPEIKNELGDIKIIILLRHPAIRAISNFHYLQKETLSLKKALKTEKKRMARGFNSFWYYKHQGFYYEQIKAYMENFSKVKIIIFDDFKTNPGKTCQEVFNFLNVDTTIKVDTNINYNATKIPKSPFRKFLLKFEHTMIPQKILMPLVGRHLRAYKKTWFIKPDYKTDPYSYNRLIDDFSSDIIKVEKMLNINLSHWKDKI